MRYTELLSPVGSKDAFFAAINCGADAVYLGLDDFSARKNADNFSRDDLSDLITFAHALSVKVYVALNTLIKADETDKFLSYIDFCNFAGVDGVILQNIFWGKFLKERYPDLPLHLSTQAGVNNVDGAIVAKNFGFSRVVVARETPIEEIKNIAAVIETECFVQGALCTAFSGQCYLSGFAGNMSGNRGLCKQPCRKRYTLSCGGEEKSGYLLSLSDLCVFDKISDYIAAGVTSFKIEGRMRKPSFVAAATSFYRSVLDGKNPSISPLKRTFNRGDYTSGLAFGQSANLISDKIQSHKGEYIGFVSSVSPAVKVQTEHKFVSGDGAKVIRDGFETGSLYFDGSQLKPSGDVRTGDKVYITTDVAAEQKLMSAKRSLPVFVKAELLCGKPARIFASCGGASFSVTGGEPLEKALSAPTDEQKIRSSLEKIDKYPFSVSVRVLTDGVFMPVSALNALRRELYAGLFEKLSFRPERRFNKVDMPVSDDLHRSRGLIVLDDEFDFTPPKNVSAAVLCPADYADKRVIDGFLQKFADTLTETYLYIPNKFSSADERAVSLIIPRFDGLYVEGTFGAELCSRHGKKLIFGTGANVYDKLSATVANGIAGRVCLSKELSAAQASDLDGYVYAAGSIKVMDLLYCPFKKTCATCRRPDFSTLSDGERNFTLRRVRLNGCRFEVYNGAYLVTKESERAVVNLIGIDKKIKPLVLSRLGDKAGLKEILVPFTSGHENKPLV